ncbi:MAG TPA: phosphoenolpyruvate--protein phosphotransferase [Solirubrobacteraceae bacterium]|nr:phosphoenolpyruvate--protein phosphotransferase [Solirubrobacteraceae bacterium]
MVGLVVVSHSEALAQGVVTLAREMGGAELKLEAAGGTGDSDPAHPILGTDAERVRAAIERAMSPDGVLVLMDLGSALMSAEFAVELLGDAPGPVLLSEAPLVEGAVAAAAAASGGASLEDVAAEARGALAMKSSQLGVEPATAVSEAPPPATADAQATLEVRNAIGLHARPAARFVETVRRFDADVRVAKSPNGQPVKATSLTNVVALGARFGDSLMVTASGPQADDALLALAQLADEGFGDGISAAAPAAAPTATAFNGPGSPANEPRGEISAPTAGEVLSGVPASAGLAVGPVHHLHGGTGPPPDRVADDPQRERERLEQGIAAARVAIERDREVVAARAGKAEAAIFDAHRMLLDDEALLEPAQRAIEAGATAERAFYDAAQEVAERYRALDEPLLRERATDVLDVGRRVVGALTGELDRGAAEGIVLAGELTPADAAALDPARVTGIATAHGTATAHAAILARALALPAVVGLGDAILQIPDGMTVLIDGEAGTLLLDPPADVQRDAAERRERADQRRADARTRAHELGATRDGTRIEVFANLGSAAEASKAVELGAEGVGLLRTEFLFLDRPELPGEEEQAETLREIATALDGRPLVVRTLDAGADKPLPALPMPPEANPFLGVRGIRLGLAQPEVLATQLRAILRVAADGYPIKVMLPMVATLDEIDRAREALEQARSDTGVDAPIEFGIMVEIPAAAVTAERLAPHVDFFSLGTNDLTQYTMAAERGDERLAPLLTGTQPAVLRLVKDTVAGADAHGRWVGVCGELAGDPAAAVLFAGLGVTELSMAPALVPDVKAALRGVDIGQARAAAHRALEVDSAAAARALGAELL